MDCENDAPGQTSLLSQLAPFFGLYPIAPGLQERESPLISSRNADEATYQTSYRITLRLISGFCLKALIDFMPE